MAQLISLLFFLIPIAAVVFFISSLSRYLSARNQSLRAPGSVSAETLRTRRILLIVSSLIAGVLAAVVIAFAVLLFTAVAFM